MRDFINMTPSKLFDYSEILNELTGKWTTPELCFNYSFKVSIKRSLAKEFK